MLLEKNGVSLFNGQAKFLSPTEIEVAADSSVSRVNAEYVVIATGARPMELPMLKQDGRTIIGFHRPQSFSQILD